jgi:F0F1-type ATP synthase membrane subunit b/b'
VDSRIRPLWAVSVFPSRTPNSCESFARPVSLGYFEQEVEKLDAWADDLKLGLEQEIKFIDVEIKEIRRTAATSSTLEEKLAHQKRQRELEGKRTKLRRELFNRQDEVEAQRSDLIAQLEKQLQQQVEERVLFTIEWELK